MSCRKILFYFNLIHSENIAFMDLSDFFFFIYHYLLKTYPLSLAYSFAPSKVFNRITTFQILYIQYPFLIALRNKRKSRTWITTFTFPVLLSFIFFLKLQVLSVSRLVSFLNLLLIVTVTVCNEFLLCILVFKINFS